MNIDVEKLLEQHNQDLKKQLEEVLNKINAGETTTINYFRAFRCYKGLQNKNEIEKYKNLTIESAQYDVNNGRGNIAQAYYVLSEMSKDNNKKIIYISKAIDISPREADYYLTRAEYYDKMPGKRRFAEADYNKACELEPRLKEIIDIMKMANRTYNATWPFYLLMIILIVLIILDFLIKSGIIW